MFDGLLIFIGEGRDGRGGSRHGGGGVITMHRVPVARATCGA